jgi:dihydrofolate synthase/folylpolyglutamate synthase
MRFDTLKQWLDWQMVLHDKAIDLGLERVAEVADRLGIKKIATSVVTVAGTNGKGSTVAAYENWLHQAGFSVASYTSPHLRRYNERVKLNCEMASDAELCLAFEAVDQARKQTALTYFEFGTLAALYLIQNFQPDYAILEVGLGGRLDAVNIIDADLIHLTPIGIDHQSWLGNDREQIGFEKAGVLRADRPVIVNDPDPPKSVLDEIERLNCDCFQLGQDYAVVPLEGKNFLWRGESLEFKLNAVLPGVHQVQNLAGVVAGLAQLLQLDNYGHEQVRDYFRGMQLGGRFELVSSSLACQLYLDVGHNQDAAKVLATSLADIGNRGGKIVVLLGMLEDKRADWFVAELKSVVDEWWLLSLDCDRGLAARQLGTRIETTVDVEQLFETADIAYEHALSSLGNEDIMLVTGSFVTVELLLRRLSSSGETRKS